MEDVGLFDYWFTWAFALLFCLWFPTYVVKTKGKGIPLWGLSFSIVCLFLFLPLLTISLTQRIVPFFSAKIAEDPIVAQSVTMLVGSVHKMATLEQLCFILGGMFIIVSIVQSAFSAWILYVRHNRESLVRAIRFMWCSAFTLVFAFEIWPFLGLGDAGLLIVTNSVVEIAVYIAVLGVITAYLRLSPAVADFYPISHTKHK